MLKRKIIILLIILIAAVSVSAVFADENLTDSHLSESDEISYNAQITAKNATVSYGEDYKVSVKDNSGNLISDVEKLRITYENTEKDVAEDLGDGHYIFTVGQNVGIHKATIVLRDSEYKAKPVDVSLNVVKSNVKMSAEKWVATTKQYTTLKVTVYTKYGVEVDEGKVKFEINGKAYTVKVKDGVAKKKIKLKKAKNYKYKATFISKNYNSKTVSSTVYVKTAKKYYTLKYSKFTVKLPYKKYAKILKAKNRGKFGYGDVDTGIARPPDWGGGYYAVGISTNDEYFLDYGYPVHDYLFLRASFYLGLKKINLYTANF